MLLQLGSINTLVISSAAAAKMVLQKQEIAFSNRYLPDAIHAHNHFQYSVVWLPVSTQWRTLRKILNSNIFTSSRLDNGINKQLRHQKVQELVAYCRNASKSGESVDIGRVAFQTTLNIISNTIFSRDIIHPNEVESRDKQLKEVVWTIMEMVGKPNLVDFFPFLKKIDPQGIRRRMTNSCGKVLMIFEEFINERLEMTKTKNNGGGEFDDVLGILLDICDQQKQDMDRSCIKSMCLDLFVAGTDTTSSTLEWAMTELLRNPQTMSKAKDELKQVIGEGKIIDENDILRLPYLNCIVKETLRIHTPVPLLLPRKVETEVELSGYIIPNGTQVFVNAWAIGHDLTTWEDPIKFKPERFFTLRHDVQGCNFELIPFGARRRICPGLPLATRMIPIMLGSLLHNFDWKLEAGVGSDELDMSEKFGLTLQKIEPLRIVPIPLA